MARRNQRPTTANLTEQLGIARAEPERNIKMAEGLKEAAEGDAEGREDRQDTARAETYRPNLPEACNGTTRDYPEDLFEPSFHPDAASSDGRKRVWHKVGKSAILIISDTENKKRDLRTGEQGEALGEKKKHPACKNKYVPGPIGVLIDQAEVVGLQLALNTNNELEFRREGRGPITLNGAEQKGVG